jgi:hypothetical protein
MQFVLLDPYGTYARRDTASITGIESLETVVVEGRSTFLVGGRKMFVRSGAKSGSPSVEATLCRLNPALECLPHAGGR